MTDQNFQKVTGLTTELSESQEKLKNFWITTMNDVKSTKPNDFKNQDLPLARIKKIMKMDEDVKMISAEAPVLFAKAAEIFINELTLRSWVHAEDNRRRTLQRNDIGMAISKYDQFDFLIDIVPREEIRTTKREDSTASQVTYFMPESSSPNSASNGITSMTQPVQILTGATPSTSQNIVQSLTDTAVQFQAQQNNTPQQQQQTMQVFTQVIGPNGEVQQVPIQLTPAQLQAIAMQVQGKQPGQPIVIHTSAEANNDPNL